jgi:hypothetical protein
MLPEQRHQRFGVAARHRRFGSPRCRRHRYRARPPSRRRAPYRWRAHASAITRPGSATNAAARGGRT